MSFLVARSLLITANLRGIATTCVLSRGKEKTMQFRGKTHDQQLEMKAVQIGRWLHKDIPVNVKCHKNRTDLAQATQLLEKMIELVKEQTPEIDVKTNPNFQAYEVRFSTKKGDETP